MSQNYIQAIEMATINAANLTGGFDLVRTLPKALFLFRILNESNASISVSYDGVTLHDRVRTLTSIDLNFQQNSRPSANVALLKRGTPIYLIGPQQAGAGFIYLIGYYQD